MALRFGANATLNYRSAGNYAAPTWSPITVVEDVKLNIAFQEANATSRGGGGTTQMEPTLLDCSIEFDMLGEIADTAFVYLRNAFYAKTLIDMRASTGAATASGELYERVECKVFEMTRGEALNGIDTYTVKLKPCYSTNPFSQGTN